MFQFLILFHKSLTQVNIPSEPLTHSDLSTPCQLPATTDVFLAAILTELLGWLTCLLFWFWTSWLLNLIRIWFNFYVLHIQHTYTYVQIVVSCYSCFRRWFLCSPIRHCYCRLWLRFLINSRHVDATLSLTKGINELLLPLVWCPLFVSISCFVCM